MNILSKIKRYKIFLVVFVLFFSPLFSEEEKACAGGHRFTSPKAEKVLEWTKRNLPQKGILKEDPNGFVYLKVDDRYVNELFLKLAPRGYEKPEKAHISVIYRDDEKKIGKIDEIGKEYSFTINEFGIVDAKTKKFLALSVNAPGLEELREKYGLTPFLFNNHCYHISIAEEKRASRRK